MSGIASHYTDKCTVYIYIYSLIFEDWINHHNIHTPAFGAVGQVDGIGPLTARVSAREVMTLGGTSTIVNSTLVSVCDTRKYIYIEDLA